MLHDYVEVSIFSKKKNYNQFLNKELYGIYGHQYIIQCGISFAHIDEMLLFWGECLTICSSNTEDDFHFIHLNVFENFIIVQFHILTNHFHDFASNMRSWIMYKNRLSQREEKY